MSGDIRLNVPVFWPCRIWRSQISPVNSSYWTKFHEILTRFRGVIYAVNAHIEIAIAHSVSEWQSDKCRGVGNFAPFLPLNWLPWQRPLRYWKKISDLPSRPKRLFIIRYKNCKNRTWFLFLFCLRHKVGCHGNVPWGIRKIGPDQEN